MKDDNIKIYTPDNNLVYLFLVSTFIGISLLIYELFFGEKDYLLIIIGIFWSLLFLIPLLGKSITFLVLNLQKNEIKISTLIVRKSIDIENIAEIKSITSLPISQIALIDKNNRTIVGDIHFFFKNAEEYVEFIRKIQIVNPNIKNNVRLDGITGLTLFGKAENSKTGKSETVASIFKLLSLVLVISLIVGLLNAIIRNNF